MKKILTKRNLEYWLDIEDWPDRIKPIKIPYKYVIEMFCDFVGASKTYNRHKPEWNEKEVWDYWIQRCKGKRLMHHESEYLIEKLLWNYYQMGEQNFLVWYKNNKKFIKTHYEQGDLYKEDLEAAR